MCTLSCVTLRGPSIGICLLPKTNYVSADSSSWFVLQWHCVAVSKLFLIQSTSLKPLQGSSPVSLQRPFVFYYTLKVEATQSCQTNQLPEPDVNSTVLHCTESRWSFSILLYSKSGIINAYFTPRSEPTVERHDNANLQRELTKLFCNHRKWSKASTRTRMLAAAG